MKASQRAIERINRLGFSKPIELTMTTSDAFPFMQEHLRRLSKWADYLQIGHLWRSLLITNISEYVVEGISLDEENEEFLDNVRTRGFYTKLTLQHYLLWSCLEDHPTIVNSNLPNPYDPLLDMYEGGAYFSRENIVVFIVGEDGDKIFSLDRDKYE